MCFKAPIATVDHDDGIVTNRRSRVFQRAGPDWIQVRQCRQPLCKRRVFVEKDDVFCIGFERDQDVTIRAVPSRTEVASTVYCTTRFAPEKIVDNRFFIRVPKIMRRPESRQQLYFDCYDPKGRRKAIMGR